MKKNIERNSLNTVHERYVYKTCAFILAYLVQTLCKAKAFFSSFPCGEACNLDWELYYPVLMLPRPVVAVRKRPLRQENIAVNT